ncbi:hypothetical protein [Bradyrhizobium centrolobii]|uniref:hypothetical protein n=1 Tax=Bradyrhizobium centrolobii TaxID=1505087 RepID=UPI0013747C56|nr:hypothetical protein [Bradyrhizobium centrolobii]
MATLEDDLRAAGLELYELPEWEGRLPIRQFWIAPSFWTWFDETELLHDPKCKVGGRTLAEHIEQLFCDLRCAKRPGGGDLRRMMPATKGVWKLHPVKTRLYGWAPKSDCLAVVTGSMESETKDKSLGNVNDQKRDNVVRFIKEHNLQKHVLLGDILALFPIEKEP